MQKVVIWYNPKCSKSCEAKGLLDGVECEIETFYYLEEEISEEKIRELLGMLKITPRELMRTKEELYEELKLSDEKSDDMLVAAMVKYPKLIERPIIIKGDKAIIARPPSLVAEFLATA